MAGPRKGEGAKGRVAALCRGNEKQRGAVNELIKIENRRIGDGRPVQTVNARDLHAFLEVRKDFSNWIKKQVERARLVEGRDFIVITGSPKRANGEFNPKPSVEYHLTIEAAKHIAMMSGCDKGFAVRDYFLECERIAKQPPVAIDLNNPEFLRAALLTYTEKAIRLEAIVDEQQPKVDALDRISAAENLLCLTDAAKNLGVRRKDLIAWMFANKWIYRRVGNGSWVAYQTKMQQGLLEHKLQPIGFVDGRERVREQVMVTTKGVVSLAMHFASSAGEAALRRGK